MTQIKIGINPLTWSNDDMPSLGGDTPLEVCLKECRQVGYDGIELGNKFDRDPDVLGPVMEKFDLQLISGWYSSRLLERTIDEEINALGPHLKLLKTLGCKVMVYCEVTRCIHGDIDKPLSGRPQMTQKEWELFLPRLDKVADYLAEQGVAMAYHHHMGTVIQSEEDVHRMMDGTGDNVGLLLDTGHMVYAGGNYNNLAEKWIHRINHVHCKDIRKKVCKDAQNRNLSFLSAVLNGAFTVPGDGFIDYPALISQLKNKDYTGWIVVEADQDPTVAHPYTYATMGYDYLSNLIK